MELPLDPANVKQTPTPPTGVCPDIVFEVMKEDGGTPSSPFTLVSNVFTIQSSNLADVNDEKLKVRVEFDSLVYPEYDERPFTVKMIDYCADVALLKLPAQV